MRRGWRMLWILGCMLIALSGCAEGARHNAAGNDLYAENAHNEALGEYQLAQVAEPDHPEPYYNAANAHNRLSQPEDVLALTEQALKTAEPALAAQAWYNLGNAFFDAQQWAAAVEAYKDALRNAPADMDAKHNLELALQKLEEEQQQQQEDESQSSDQQDEGDEQQNEDQESQEEGQEQQPEDQGEGGAAIPTPSDQGEDSSSNDESGDEPATPQPSGADDTTEGMTQEQAIQLLRAVLGDSETLQERLQELYMPAQGSTGEDW